MYLFRMSFYSDNNMGAGERPIASEIKAILAACSRYTLASGITGALVFNERYFVQVMEGERSLLSRTVWSIASDARQKNMVLLSAAPINERLFLGWSVGYAGHSEQADALYLRHAIMGALDPSRMTAESVENLVAEFVTGENPFVISSRHAAAAPPPKPAPRAGETIKVRPAPPSPRVPTTG
ncbi:BLUF domain-containing protein [Methylobrevis albus]|uniref:BLUF domain-containing protein n=1 Tax=Methylobrevis albus TaxID=2793297 RepID=A0A931I3Q0_9HYPH|nr:BLUF domain-containing protein [Methylobrevis albus]MBH0238303.1 BLUF domain-containing protein [Methylobrevis albus]